MAVGINTDKVHSLQIGLLDSIESLKAIKERYENCSIAITANIEGDGKSTIVNNLEKLKSQLTIVISNIDSYITDLNKIIDNYKDQDYEINQKIIRDVNKIVDMEGE